MILEPADSENETLTAIESQWSHVTTNTAVLGSKNKPGKFAAVFTTSAFPAPEWRQLGIQLR